MAKASLSTPIAPKPQARCPKSALTLEHESNSPQGRGAWYARVPAEHTIEDVTTPEYFGSLQVQYGGLRAGDVIDVEPENGLWTTRLRVMAIVPALQHIKTRELHGLRHDFSVEAPDGYRYEWRGGDVKWAIIRLSDLVTIDGGFDTQDEAAARLEIIEAKTAA